MTEWKKIVITTLIAGLIGGLGSTLLVESYYRPKQLRTEIQSHIYLQTYDKRVQLYQSLIEMFSDAYWLEVELKNEPSETVREKRRLVLMQKIQRDITRSSVITNHTIFVLSFNAFNFYVENCHNFTPDIRRKWLSEYFDPLLKAIRVDSASR